MRAIHAAMLAFVLVGGCESKKNSIGGLLSSNAQFTTSDDRCTISMLFDNFELRRPPVGKPMSATRSLTIAGGADRSFVAIIKGAKIAPNTGARLTMKIGEKEYAQTVAPTSEDVDLTYEGTLGAGSTILSFTAAMDEGETEALLSIDSLDIVIGSKGETCR